MYYAHCSVLSVTVFNFAHPPVLSAVFNTARLHIPRIPCIGLSAVDARAFSVFGPSTWNVLPFPPRQKLYLDSFKAEDISFPKTTDMPCFPFLNACFLRPPQVCLLSV